MRKTKIICTIGPACEQEETVRQMLHAGMNVARLNFSHGTHEEHAARIATIKKLREELQMPIAIMLDTKGPEYRIRCFRDGSVTLQEGDTFTFTSRDVPGDQSCVSVSYAALPGEMRQGDRILLCNGLMSFLVRSVEETEIHCVVEIGGTLSDHKSMSFPGKVLCQPYLSEQDKGDLLFGIEQDVDFIACSFVSGRQDLLDVQNFLQAHGAKGIELIAKIENQAGVDHIEEICESCDGVMVARGDLGVEIAFEELPAIQKHLITKCRMLGKRVITATEMLESMISNSRPTRAETSDVANAVYDGTSAVMLSGETAAGKYPVLAVQTMARIAEQTEQNIHYSKRFHRAEFQIRNMVDAISHATCGLSMDVDAEAIVACTLSGMTARMVSRFRAPADILGLTTDRKTYHKLALSWGVTPALCDVYESTDILFYTAKQIARQVFSLKKGARLIVTGGMTNGRSGNTNTLKVEVI